MAAGTPFSAQLAGTWTKWCGKS